MVKVDPAEAREDAASSRNSQFSTYGLPEDFRDHSFDLVADIDQHPMRVKWIRQLMVALEAHAESWGPTEAEFESMVIGHATRAKGMMTPQQTYFTLMHMTEILSDAGKVGAWCVCVCKCVCVYATRMHSTNATLQQPFFHEVARLSIDRIRVRVRAKA